MHALGETTADGPDEYRTRGSVRFWVTDECGPTVSAEHGVRHSRSVDLHSQRRLSAIARRSAAAQADVSN